MNDPRPPTEDDRLGAMLGRTSVHPQGQEYGLSKRELFAAMAMQGLLMHESYLNVTRELVASEAVMQADRLLKELARG